MHNAYSRTLVNGKHEVERYRHYTTFADMMAFSLITAMLFLIYPPIKQMTASFGPYSHYDSDLGHYDGHI